VEDSRGFVLKTEEYWQIQASHITESDVCQLKVRSEEGKVFILLLGRHKHIKDVYFYMRKVAKTGFKVMSNFPRRSY
jgi:hypothetical protein